MEDLDPNYTKACSEKTIQSDPNGFFAEFYNEVLQTCSASWLKDRFKSLESDSARIMSLFNDPEVCAPVLGILEHVRPVYKEKDAALSSQRRLQGEKFYLMEDNKKALMMLNHAVVRAPEKGIDKQIDGGYSLALAYWTRSTILLTEKDGANALQDLKLAVKYGYNTKDNPEYYWRMAKAYALMGEDAKSKISLGISEKLYGGERHKIEKNRQEIGEIVPSSQEDLNKNLEMPNLTGGEHPNYKAASKLLDVVETHENGKFMIAKDNIKTGDVIIVEEPMVACLLPKLYGNNCLHCFKRLVIPVGCPNCSGVAFCSDDCMTTAWTTYHKYECQFSDLMIGSGMSILCYLALRVFTQAANIDEGLKTATDLISKLCSHKEMRAPQDFLQRTLMAAFLLRILQKAEYFGRRITEAVDPIGKELEVGAALLGLLQVFQFNAHEIHQILIAGDHKIDNAKTLYIGAAIYKTGSLLNHDCCPGVARLYVGKTMVLVCTRPVIAGVAISENYGPIVTKMSLKERQRSLRSRYWFKCKCTACTEGWPTLQKMDHSVKFKCPTAGCTSILKYPKDITKDVRCSGCRKNVSLVESAATVFKSEAKYRDAAHAMNEQRTEDAIEAFKEGISLLHEVAVLPHKDTLIAQESLRTCYFDTGTKFRV